MKETISKRVHSLILGTAGHIDHGKTTLVRALTGVDTDRLPEEKLRGLTIDLGFAELDLGAFRLGVVDVPGHERFIKNMLAGSAAIDIAILVVAADDGVMPQTREHLAILNLLSVRCGVIAITKCDTRSRERVELVAADLRQLVRGTCLEHAPIVFTALGKSTDTCGVDELKSALYSVCNNIVSQQNELPFRLPVDRSFTVTGRGAVVTGSVWSGTATVGDELELYPAGRLVSIRGLENHGRQVSHIQQGQRAAINLAGVRHTDIRRGFELATPGYLKPTRLLTVTIQVLGGSPRPIKHRSRQRLYIGTQEIMVRVMLHNRSVLGPTETGFAQLVCQEPTLAISGQPFVIRAESPLMTIGGGRVLQPSARRVWRKGEVDQAWLDSLAGESVEARIDSAIYYLGTSPWTILDVSRDANVSLSIARDALSKMTAGGRLLEIEIRSGGKHQVHEKVLAGLEQRIKKTVLALERTASPLEQGVARSQLIARFADADDRLLIASIERLLARGELAGDDSILRMPGPALRLPVKQIAKLDRLLATLDAANASPPTHEELFAMIGASRDELAKLLRYAVNQRRLIQVGPGFFLSTAVESGIRKTVGQAIADNGPRTVSQIKELLNTSRKYAVPICEYLDKIGLTKRVGNLRTLA